TANFGCVFPHHHNLTVYGTAATVVPHQHGRRPYPTRDPSAAPRPRGDPFEGAATGHRAPAIGNASRAGRDPGGRAAEVVDAMAVSIAIEQAATQEPTVRL